MSESSDLALSALAAAWVLVGLLAFFAAPNRERFLARLRGPLLGFYTVLLTLTLVESGLRIMWKNSPPAVWRPGMRLVFDADPQIFPGASKVVHFRVNEFGLRGPDLPQGKDVYKIVALGGSTTLCLMLDDEKSWPAQLMEEMNQRQKVRTVWVSNAGVNGHTAAHHLVMLHSLPILRRSDLVLFLPGINDFQYSLAFGGASTQALLEKGADKFQEYLLSGADFPYPFYRRLLVYRLLRKTIDVSIERTNSTQQQETWDENELRKVRATKPVVPMPDLTVALAEYHLRLQAIGAECHNLGIRCLFLTQPSIWRPKLSPEMQSLLIFGWIGPKFRPQGYASISDLEKGIDTYNQVLLDVCKHSDVECLDLAAALPKDDSIFYDDVHFTENGAVQVAHAISNYLLSRPPFPLPAGKVANSVGLKVSAGN